MKLNSLVKVGSGQQREERKWETRSDMIESSPGDIEARYGQLSILTPCNVYPWQDRELKEWSQSKTFTGDLLQHSIAGLMLPDHIKIDSEEIFVVGGAHAKKEFGSIDVKRFPFGTVGLMVGVVNILNEGRYQNVRKIDESKLQAGNDYAVWSAVYIEVEQPAIENFLDLIFGAYGQNIIIDIDVFTAKSGIYLLPPNFVKPRVE